MFSDFLFIFGNLTIPHAITLMCCPLKMSPSPSPNRQAQALNVYTDVIYNV